MNTQCEDENAWEDEALLRTRSVSQDLACKDQQPLE